MKEFPDIILWSVPAFVLLIALERLSYLVHDDDDKIGYGARDTATSLTMGLGSVVTDAVWKVPVAAVYALLYSVTPLRVDESWWSWPLILLAVDFCAYWSHRAHHRVRILWATHVVHHSSQRFNLSTALRQPWTSLASGFFYLPLVLAGVHPAVVAFCGTVNLVYGFWVHTERIDRLPRWYEALFSTPSHHRVHHASQGGYLDRNFGVILIVWDRFFGTFAPERERCRYGLTENIHTYNPLRVAFHEYAAIARDVRGVGSWRHRVGLLFRPPGWTPAPAELTAAGAVPPVGRTSSAPG
ncbi:MAG TPA: sterol desaturase family protein [Micromonospora sp.]